MDFWKEWAGGARRTAKTITARRELRGRCGRMSLTATRRDRVVRCRSPCGMAVPAGILGNYTRPHPCPLPKWRGGKRSWDAKGERPSRCPREKGLGGDPLSFYLFSFAMGARITSCLGMFAVICNVLPCFTIGRSDGIIWRNSSRVAEP